MRYHIPSLVPVVLLAACTTYVPVSVPGQGVSPGAPVFASANGAPTSVAAQTKNIAMTLTIGEEKGLATYLKDTPELLLPGAVIWVSTDEKVVSVDSATGVAKALKEGNVVVLGISKADPNKKFTFDVTVGESRSVLLIRVEPGKPTIKPGEKVKLMAEVRLVDGQVNSNVIWSSSDDTVATVNGTTGEVSALKEGKVTILASYAADNKYKGAAELSVVSAASDLSASSQMPTSIVFGPEATPLPIKTVTPKVVYPTREDTPNPEETTSIPIGSQIISDSKPQGNSSNGAVIEFDSYKLIHDDDLSRFPENGDELIHRGERVLVELSLKNTGSAATQDLKVLVLESDDNLSIGYYSLNYTRDGYNARIPGIEFGKMLPDGSSVVGEYLVAFGVSKTAPLGAKIPFTLSATDTFGNAWTQKLNLQLP